MRESQPLQNFGHSVRICRSCRRFQMPISSLFFVLGDPQPYQNAFIRGEFSMEIQEGRYRRR